MKKKRRGTYLHGFSRLEQRRLLKQARFLEDRVYQGIDFSGAKHILEVGCGVGAQTAILLKRFKHLKITAIDFSHEQIEVAKRRLAKDIKKGRVELIQMDAQKLGKLNGKFDGAFLCWFLEHVPDPLKVLKEVKKVLKSRAVIYCTEVQNSSYFVDPYSPAVLKYWYEFNDFQWINGHHPFIGTKLGNLLKAAGFKNITTDPRIVLVDSRDEKERKAFFRYFSELLLSASPQLIAAKKISPELAKQVRQEMDRHTSDRNSVLFDTWMRAKAFR